MLSLRVQSRIRCVLAVEVLGAVDLKSLRIFARVMRPTANTPIPSTKFAPQHVVGERRLPELLIPTPLNGRELSLLDRGPISASTYSPGAMGCLVD